MRPYGPIVIRERIVAGLTGRESANPPSAIEVLRKQGLSHSLSALIARNAGKKAMPGVRRPHLACSFFAVESQRINVQLLAPERVFKLVAEIGCLLFQLRRVLLISQHRTKPRGSQLCRV